MMGKEGDEGEAVTPAERARAWRAALGPEAMRAKRREWYRAAKAVRARRRAAMRMKLRG